MAPPAVMTSLKTLNPKAEVMGASGALFMNINAAKGLRDVMKTNLGPKGTIKMLVGGSGGAQLRRSCRSVVHHVLQVCNRYQHSDTIEHPCLAASRSRAMRMQSVNCVVCPSALNANVYKPTPFLSNLHGPG